MDDVIYLTYNNNQLNTFIEDMFGDYGEIFGRMIKAQMRNYQIRVLKMDTSKIGKKTNKKKCKSTLINFLKYLRKIQSQWHL